MRNQLLIGLTVAGVFALALAFTLGPHTAAAGPPKNLKVLPKDLDKKAVKKIMKRWSKALGVECDYCHDEDDMAKETKKKKIARKMFRMTERINQRHLKKYEAEVTCKTCHQGNEEPKR